MKNRRFLRLWAACSASVLGDQIYFLAVPLLIFTEGATASTMALIKTCTLLPQAAFGVFGGVIADRRDKIGFLRLAYLGSSVTLLLALAGYLTLPDARLPVLACAALAHSAFAALSAASIDSALPHFVAPHELARANSMTETTRTVAAGAPTKRYGGAMALSIVLQGVGIAIVPLGNSLPTAICGQILLAVFTVVYTVCWRAYRQSVCEPRLLGRVSGACRPSPTPAPSPAACSPDSS